MDVRAEVLLTVLGMAMVTYGTRIAGYWLATRLPATGHIQRWLDGLAGALLASIAGPLVVSGGLADRTAAAVTIVVAARTRRMFLAMMAGVLTIIVLRHFGGYRQ